ncbi:hypothetical protein JAAARDRAFT_128693, partial [Jaapia argillacea MUCL 33604]
GMVMYGFYFNWRHQGSFSGRGVSFALYCLFATAYACYAASWDFLMDWSVLKPHVQHRWLRQDILYSDHVYMYYFAIISNIFIRFIWVIYIPIRGPNAVLRTFIAAMLEMLRRWQWNFYRLENEHLGNVDQYRVTREVPLPYTIEDEAVHDEKDGDEEGVRSRFWRRKQSSSLDAARGSVDDVGRKVVDSQG